MSIKTRIILPNPHEKQREFIDSPAKRKVIVAGRRGGKTTGVSMLAATAFLGNRRILYAAPTQEQTDAFWTAVKKYFAEPIAKKYIYKNETEHIIEFNNARIRAKTAWNSDTLRGDYCDLLILEEWSLMEPSAWDEVGAPMLLDNNGDAVFIFTPKRRNHAYQTYQKAVQDDTGRWKAWHFTSLDNPYLSKEALAEITADMTDEAYRQEIMAEFLESEGVVFRNIAACMRAKPTIPDEHKGHHIIGGVDWAKQSDYTCISIGCRTCMTEIAHDRFNQIDYKVQRDRIKTIAEKWGVKELLVERNSIGDPNLEMLIRDGLPARGFDTTATSKPPLIENLALAFERGEWQFINDPIWTAELESYERKVNANTGRASYGAPEGLHDDTVMARALMLRMATGSVGVLFEV